ncbi:MAG TPA: gephyrin-like molybdotransferase Glp [Fimbriiglobus sp.]|jgi:molybdopterin molybdotransferase
MLEVRAALDIVLRHVKPLPAVTARPVLGDVLAENVAADRDSPPFTKSAMDGYAVRAADCQNSAAILHIIDEVAAGDTPGKSVGPGECVRIFTGAPIPDGADAVVMVEKTETIDHGRVRVDEAGVHAGVNVIPRGIEMQAGEVVLPAGTVLTPAAIGLLAGIGRASVATVPAPKVNILATGNELVDVTEVPGPGQIRNSNGPMIAALATRAGAVATHLGIVKDDPRELTARIRAGLEGAAGLILAGGVSAGAADLVPGVLAELGVTTHFHRVRLKPGKPLLFGTIGDKFVFGLPGNPVSAFVCFALFVCPAIRALAGHADPGPHLQPLPLAGPLATTNDRPTYYPAKLFAEGKVTPLPWFGSADLRAMLAADALLALPAGSVSLPAGHVMDVLVL